MRRAALLALAAALSGAPPAAAQEPCVAVAGVGINALSGIVFLDRADGDRTRGWSIGAGAAGEAAGFGVAGDAEVVFLDGAPGRPLIVRLRGTRALTGIAGIRVCGDARAGVAATAAERDRALSVAGGAGLTLAAAYDAGRARLTPYIGGRGLAARTSATLLGTDIVATGLSVGAEAGLLATAGRLTAALSVAGDGFDAGLGPTPYPALAVRASLGWAF